MGHHLRAEFKQVDINVLIDSVPDEKGIVELNVNGSNRKFVKDKLLKYLQARGVKPKPVKKKKGEHKQKPIIAITPDNKEIPFKSSAEAARDLKICRTNIPHVLSGRYKHVSGYKFKYAV